jgi:hypothetical protein
MNCSPDDVSERPKQAVYGENDTLISGVCHLAENRVEHRNIACEEATLKGNQSIQ